MKKPHPLESKPWKKPTAKLPRARTFVADYDASYPAEVRFETYETMADQKDNRPDLAGFHVAFLPTHTAAQARQICKAAKFLQLSEGEQVRVLIMAMHDEGGSGHDDLARAILRAMGLGGGK